jgi:hypothetical protein
MILGTFRRIVMLILIVVISVFTLIAWFGIGVDPLEVSDPAKGLSSITWAASVAPDGRLAVTVRYDFSDEASHSIDVRVPTGARLLAINGQAVSASIGLYATGSASGQAVVSYELPGAVTRYRDGSLLRLATINETSINGDQGLFSCPSCYIDGVEYGNTPVYGALAVPGADAARLQFIGLDPIRSDADEQVVRFVGIDAGTSDVSMLATLSAAAAPDLPIRDGTVAQALAAARAELKPSGDALHAPKVPNEGSLWTPMILTIVLTALLAWFVVSMMRPTARERT